MKLMGKIAMLRPKPFFGERRKSDLWIMSLGVGANFASICFAAAYLVYAYEASAMTWPYLLVVGLGGYFLADFASGLVHWGMDTWFSERELGRAVAIAREHHTHPQHILGYGFLEYSALGSTPSAIVVGPAAIVRFHWVGESEAAADGKKSSTNLHILMNWQKQAGEWKLLSRASTKL